MAKFSKLPPLEHLRQAVEYNPDTGRLTWLVRPASQFASERYARMWNERYAGTPAFNIWSDQCGFHGGFSGRKYVAHRIAYYLATGIEPEGELDHINGDHGDNRLANLRPVNAAENARNRARNFNSTAPAHGVYLRPSGKFEALIKFEGRQIALGHYLTCEEAMAARVGAERALGFHPNHGKRVSEGKRQNGRKRPAS